MQHIHVFHTAENPPSPLFKGENSGSVLLHPAPNTMGDMTDTVLLPLENGAGGIRIKLSR